ncbi:MAG: hypothetical protein IKM34_00570 [Clostridia bacterium]|nr:hypothetical protein [Clostridia bacterium]
MSKLTYQRMFDENDSDIHRMYDKIEISIDERNTASLKLFENVGFIRLSQEEELISMVYRKKEDFF